MNEFDDFFGKDLDITNLEPKDTVKKKVDGKAKGNRGELQLAKLLSKHFGKEFSRGVGSGNRWSQVASMPQHAKDTFLGDICVPEGFLWVVECKDGYDDDIDLGSLKAVSTLDKWLETAARDSEMSGRKPILCWKRSRKPWVAFVREQDIGEDIWCFEYFVNYRDWHVVDLNLLLMCKKKETGFWFTEKS